MGGGVSDEHRAGGENALQRRVGIDLGINRLRRFGLAAFGSGFGRGGVSAVQHDACFGCEVGQGR